MKLRVTCTNCGATIATKDWKELAAKMKAMDSSHGTVGLQCDECEKKPRDVSPDSAP